VDGAAVGPLVERIGRSLGAQGVEVLESLGMPVLQIAPAQLREVVDALRTQFGFDMLLDLTAVDWLGQPGDSPRFEVVWHFFASATQTRLRVKTRVGESDPTVASLKPLYGSAAFMERECHEMFGIRFAGNDDLRPILLYEGFVGHPLRRDYAKEHEQPLVRYRDDAPGGPQ
jgi:NADH-quinone oxidoreductase subunit C